jgi:hypothetical protein
MFFRVIRIQMEVIEAFEPAGSHAAIVVEGESIDDRPSSSRLRTAAPTELVRARTIRNVRPEPVEQFAPGTAMAGLQSWLRRVS